MAIHELKKLKMKNLKNVSKKELKNLASNGVMAQSLKGSSALKKGGWYRMIGVRTIRRTPQWGWKPGKIVTVVVLERDFGRESLIMPKYLAVRG